MSSLYKVYYKSWKQDVINVTEPILKCDADALVESLKKDKTWYYMTPVIDFTTEKSKLYSVFIHCQGRVYRHKCVAQMVPFIEIANAAYLKSIMELIKEFDIKLGEWEYKISMTERHWSCKDHKNQSEYSVSIQEYNVESYSASFDNPESTHKIIMDKVKTLATCRTEDRNDFISEIQTLLSMLH